MSTRGAFGFRIDGVDKITYNHCDSYPDGLGADVVRWVRKACAPDLIEQTMTEVAGIEMAPSGQALATPEHIKRTGRRYINMGVGSGDGIGQDSITYYRLLREAQPSCGIAGVVDAGVMIEGAEFMTDSVFCEYAYIVNFDELTVEFYKGFQSKPHSKGRYASLPSKRDYFPVALVGAYPIANVAEWAKTWHRESFPREDD